MRQPFVGEFQELQNKHLGEILVILLAARRRAYSQPWQRL